MEKSKLKGKTIASLIFGALAGFSVVVVAESSLVGTPAPVVKKATQTAQAAQAPVVPVVQNAAVPSDASAPAVGQPIQVSNTPNAPVITTTTTQLVDSNGNAITNPNGTVVQNNNTGFANEQSLTLQQYNELLAKKKYLLLKNEVAKAEKNQDGNAENAPSSKPDETFKSKYYDINSAKLNGGSAIAPTSQLGNSVADINSEPIIAVTNLIEYNNIKMAKVDLVDSKGKIISDGTYKKGDVLPNGKKIDNITDSYVQIAKKKYYQTSIDGAITAATMISNSIPAGATIQSMPTSLPNGMGGKTYSLGK